MITVAKRKSRAAWLSVGSNSTLIVGKLIVGLAIGSVSVLSEAIHSGVDLLAAIIALVAVQQSAKPADERHPFGHGKFENLSGTIEALLIFAAAAWIIYEAIRKLAHPAPLEQASWGVAVMGVSVCVNWAVSRYLMRVGKETDSMALQADAWHLRTDVYTSLGVTVALTCVFFGDSVVAALGLGPQQTALWQDLLHVLDPLAAIVVAMLILRAAYTLTLQSARDLMDVQLPQAELQWVHDMLRNFGPPVHGFHRMRTRKAGASRFIDFHIFVDPMMTVERSHSLAHELARRIEEHFGHPSVTVHVEPCRGTCERPEEHASRRTD